MNTKKVNVECICERGIDSMALPGIVVKNPGPIAWDKDATVSVYRAVEMDVVGKMNLKTLLLNP